MECLNSSIEVQQASKLNKSKESLSSIDLDFDGYLMVEFHSRKLVYR
jgi:hypothetical protein